MSRLCVYSVASSEQYSTTAPPAAPLPLPLTTSPHYCRRPSSSYNRSSVRSHYILCMPFIKDTTAAGKTRYCCYRPVRLINLATAQLLTITDLYPIASWHTHSQTIGLKHEIYIISLLAGTASRLPLPSSVVRLLVTTVKTTKTAEAIKMPCKRGKLMWAQENAY